MAVLAVDTPPKLHEGDFIDLPVLAAAKIFEGALVGVDANGWAHPLVTTDVAFAGIASRQADNTSGANGAISVKVRRAHLNGKLYAQCTVTGATQAGVGDPVYAINDNPNDCTLTVATNKLVGKLSHFIAGTTCQVRFDPDI